MTATRWLISIVLIGLAGLAGWLGAREYRPPADAGEQRLGERAMRLYLALSIFDFETIHQLYTPAQQQAEASELNKKARRWKQVFEKDFEESHRRDLTMTAEALKPGDLEIRIEGDWALIRGEHDVYVEGQVVKMALDPTVWVRSGGDWWMYQLSNPELVAYGNPPDFARQVIFKRGFQEATLDMDTGEVLDTREELLEQQRIQEQLQKDAGEDGN